jgi:hypothetical protein
VYRKPKDHFPRDVSYCARSEQIILEMVKLGFFNKEDSPEQVWPAGHMKPQTCFESRFLVTLNYRACPADGCPRIVGRGDMARPVARPIGLPQTGLICDRDRFVEPQVRPAGGRGDFEQFAARWQPGPADSPTASTSCKL